MNINSITPLFKEGELYYFWAEDWATKYGPYKTEDELIDAYKNYCKNQLFDEVNTIPRISEQTPINPPEAYCKVCGKLCNVYPNDGTKGVCPEHCEDHDYYYVEGEQKWECKNCGVEPPDDFYDMPFGE